MANYERRSFSAEVRTGRTITHDVYERGEGPPIVLIQELPGIGPETLHLADELVEAGFRVVLPHLFGRLGRVELAANVARVLCMWREFSLFSRNESSPVVDWLRALCNDVRERTGAPGVGVIGMCLTGNFAISLMADDSVLAAVASQPAMPMTSQSALHMSDLEISIAKQRLDRQGPMLAFRFDCDPMCSPRKFKAIDKAFNDGDVERIKLEELPGKGHSVLTLDFVDEEHHPTRKALESVLRYFDEKLK
jgi:dienelactone hydrolase